MVIKTIPETSNLEKFFIFEAKTSTNNVKETPIQSTDYTDDAELNASSPDDKTSTANDTTDSKSGGTDNQEDDTSDDDTSSADATDYTDDGDTGDDSTEDNLDDGTNNEEDNSDEKVQKYNLYREFMRLYASTKKYENKLSNMVKDSIEGNMVISNVTKKLSEIKKLIYEYLTIKFHSVEYAEALLYFHTCVESIELLLKIIKNNETFIKQ